MFFTKVGDFSKLMPPDDLYKKTFKILPPPNPCACFKAKPTNARIQRGSLDDPEFYCKNTEPLTCHITFPSYQMIGNILELQHAYYSQSSGGVYEQSRPFVLMFEITHSFSVTRPQVYGRSLYDEHPVNLIMYTDNNKSNAYKIHSNDFKVGHTVCLLNVHYKNFMDGSMGIRFEDDDTLMTFPAPLKEVMDEARKVAHNLLNRDANQPYTCHECGKTGSDEAPVKMRCSACNLCYYCDQACQAQHWKRSHKKLCVYSNPMSLLFAIECLNRKNSSRKVMRGGILTEMCKRFDSVSAVRRTQYTKSKVCDYDALMKMK